MLENLRQLFDRGMVWMPIMLLAQDLVVETQLQDVDFYTTTHLCLMMNNKTLGCQCL